MMRNYILKLQHSFIFTGFRGYFFHVFSVELPFLKIFALFSQNDNLLSLEFDSTVILPVMVSQNVVTYAAFKPILNLPKITRYWQMSEVIKVCSQQINNYLSYL